MINKAMERKLNSGEAIDVSGCQRSGVGDYILTEFTADVDYCDKKREVWIWSIGRHKETGEIRASTSNTYYHNNDYECLWLR